jgi:hypothetical protein
MCIITIAVTERWNDICELTGLFISAIKCCTCVITFGVRERLQTHMQTHKDICFGS